VSIEYYITFALLNGQNLLSGTESFSGHGPGTLVVKKCTAGCGESLVESCLEGAGAGLQELLPHIQAKILSVAASEPLRLLKQVIIYKNFLHKGLP